MAAKLLAKLYRETSQGDQSNFWNAIAESVADCDATLGVIHSEWTPVPGRFKDYIAIPRVNGYQSLHTTLFGMHGVPIEVQIRTKQMDTIAENGIRFLLDLP